MRTSILVKLRGLIWASSFLFCPQVFCNGLSPSDTQAIDQAFRTAVSDNGIPGLSALVFKENQILFERQYGVSDVAANTPLEADDLFLLASVSKVITGTALMRAVDGGKVALTDEINDVLPYDVNVPGFTTPITVEMLLTHTSAIEDGDKLYAQEFADVDSNVALKDFFQSYLVPGGADYSATQNFYNWRPGTRHEYSNAASALIGVIIEESIDGTTVDGVTDKSFNTFCKNEIFKPLGLQRTFWRLDEIAAAGENLVTPYRKTSGTPTPIAHPAFTDYPNGGLHSTARDLHKIITAFGQEGNSGGYQLLKPATVQAMATPQIPAINDFMGYHLFKMDTPDDVWGHEGGIDGVATIVGVSRVNQVGVIILSNLGQVGDGVMEDLFFEAYDIAVNYRSNDPDKDTVPNNIDEDDDNDGILDSAEGNADTDGDGILDRLDLDSDNDSISDLAESGNTNLQDMNHDGVADGSVDSTGVISGSGSNVRDSDASGAPDYKALDSDGDGILDIQENGYQVLDTNNDGKIDGNTDGDDDGILDVHDQDDFTFGGFPTIQGSHGAGVTDDESLTLYAFGDGGGDIGLEQNLDGTVNVSIVRPVGRFDLDYEVHGSNNLINWSKLTTSTPNVSIAPSGKSVWRWSDIDTSSVMDDRKGFIQVTASDGGEE